MNNGYNLVRCVCRAGYSGMFDYTKTEKKVLSVFMDCLEIMKLVYKQNNFNKFTIDTKKPL